ncbi:hypothetical protein OE766_06875 [Pararhizobium sp. YC-54]|uniref:hypothetical protein n=1 Tax=Pararhizobium sp. YC-54 TaxID=2986920 RepID=UPI0021F7103C|nr:hypothetical protein [Pararhizobium sp. YC-54]MCV9997964.1 hypothetical protein [Pararhizobium sp. YC-54]
MSNESDVQKALIEIISRYHASFVSKVYSDENNDHDVIMDLFGVTPILKRENRQYWGRELGMCWQMIVSSLCKVTCENYHPAKRFGADEPYDLLVGDAAIDTKYRIGSGDSGTLKKFEQYGPLLKGEGYNPVLLIVRSDNLSAAITACKSGGWDVYHGKATFDYIAELTKFDLYGFLDSLRGRFVVER